MVLVFDDSRSLAHRHLHGPGVDQVLSDEWGSGSLFWALADDQGTVEDVVRRDAATGAAQVVEHRRYDAFGNLVEAVNPSGATDSTLDPATALSGFLYSYTGRERNADAVVNLPWSNLSSTECGRVSRLGVVRRVQRLSFVQAAWHVGPW